MRLLWDAWLAYAHRAGGYQSTVILNLVYFVLFGPSALTARLTGSPLLDLSTRPATTYWLKREPAQKTITQLSRQF